MLNESGSCGMTSGSWESSSEEEEIEERGEVGGEGIGESSESPQRLRYAIPSPCVCGLGAYAYT